MAEEGLGTQVAFEIHLEGAQEKDLSLEWDLKQSKVKMMVNKPINTVRISSLIIISKSMKYWTIRLWDPLLHVPQH